MIGLKSEIVDDQIEKTYHSLGRDLFVCISKNLDIQQYLNKYRSTWLSLSPLTTTQDFVVSMCPSPSPPIPPSLLYRIKPEVGGIYKKDTECRCWVYRKCHLGRPHNQKDEGRVKMGDCEFFFWKKTSRTPLPIGPILLSVELGGKVSREARM